MTKEKSYLSLAIRRFFQSLNAEDKTLNVVEQIQTQLEKGHTAIQNDETIEGKSVNKYLSQENDLIGFKRFHQQEMFIKEDFLLSQLQTKTSTEDTSNAIEQVIEIIDYQTTKTIDLQWQASISFLNSARFILNGGPGTGKTTTVVRMLLLYFIINPNKKVALTAPTGKAANRMLQSLMNLVDSFKTIDPELKQKLQLEAKTLHRLLGYNPQNNKLKYHQQNQLEYDLVIVDEASMLDVSLTHCLLKALKPNTQLLLIGDKNQLPAVEAGNVFADLCGLIEGNKREINLLDYYLNFKENDSITLANKNYVELKKNYRFEQGSQVALCCEAIKHKQFTQLQELQKSSKLTWLNPQNHQQKSQYLANWYQTNQQNDSAIILSPINQGTNSVDELNALAMQILHPQSNNIMQEGLPVLITQNDYTLNVFNGDIGYLIYRNNQWNIAFIDFAETRYILAAAINHWKVAYAISIHKSQGSEYDHVLITLPEDQDLEILTNQLLYTAASRAKKSVTIWSSHKILKLAINRDEKRITFLNHSKKAASIK